jgi:integrase
MAVVRTAKGKYQATYRGADGRERQQTFSSKLDAQQWERERRADVSRGSWTDPTRSKLTLGRWAESYMAGRVHLKPKTLAGYESLLRTQILPRWAEVPLRNVGHADVVAWVAAMRAGGLSASRTRQAYHLLSAMLDAAVRDRRLVSNPAGHVDLPRLPRTERRYLTHEQLLRFAEACGPYELLVLVLGRCGLRWGELAALRVRHVELLRRRLRVVEAMTEVNGVAVFGEPKTHQVRDVPFGASLHERLAQQVAGRAPEDFVFPAARGGVFRVNAFRRSTFDAAARSVGLEGLVPHELRHTAASLAIAAGANIKVVQAMLGHASATLTWDRYGHLYPDDLDTVAERIDTAASAVRPRPADSLADFSRTSRTQVESAEAS